MTRANCRSDSSSRGCCSTRSCCCCCCCYCDNCCCFHLRRCSSHFGCVTGSGSRACWGRGRAADLSSWSPFGDDSRADNNRLNELCRLRERYRRMKREKFNSTGQRKIKHRNNRVQRAGITKCKSISYYTTPNLIKSHQQCSYMEFVRCTRARERPNNLENFIYALARKTFT
jgi:hypothetical protein